VARAELEQDYSTMNANSAPEHATEVTLTDEPSSRGPVASCLFNARTWNITARTVHLAAMGILLGGYAFAVEPSRLVPSLLACVVSGLILTALETSGRLTWFHQGRGLVTFAKLLLICAVPLCKASWSLQMAALMGIVVLASVGSHMPARFRYYSVWYHEVIRCSGGPGVTRLAEEVESGDV